MAKSCSLSQSSFLQQNQNHIASDLASSLSLKTQQAKTHPRSKKLSVRSTMRSGSGKQDGSGPDGKVPDSTGSAFSNGFSHSQTPSSSSSQPSSSSANGTPATSTDPLWKDVFPTYLQNRESNLPFGRSSSETNLADPTRANMSLPPSSSQSQGFYLSPRGSDFPAYRNTASQYYSPAEVGMPQYLRDSTMRHDPIWAAIRAEAKLEAEQEPILSSFLYASILAHDCFERSVGFVLANRLKNVTLLATQLMDVFDDVLMRPDIREAIRADVQAVRDRDPSCRSYSQALLYYKGYHALQSYRIAHALWNRGQKILALALQSRISEVFAVDIHPAARIGQGILMDHGTGVVIGETAVVGDRVSMLQGVTLGGTGKEAGDRHPKVQEGVLIGAGATILGNISIGKGSMIAAGSLVLKDVPPHSMVAGTPAKIVGTLSEMTPSLTMKHDATREYCDNFDNIGEGL